MSSVNKVILIGNLGKDPEIKTFQNGGKIATFSIATSERWKDRTTGEQREKTEWHNISIQGDGLVGIVEQFTRKGNKVYVEGKLQTRKWLDRDGSDRYTTEILIDAFNGKIVLLDGKNDTPKSGAHRNQDGWGGGSGSAQNPTQSSASYDTDLDDEVPF